MKARRVSLLVAAASALVGCDVSVADQAVLLRHDPAAGTLEAVFVYEGVSLTEKGDPEKAAALAHHVLSGAPYVAVLPGLGVDFGAPEDDWSEAERAAARGVHVEEVEAYLDPAGRLSAYQLVRFDDVEALLAATNASLDAEFLEQAPDDGASAAYRAWYERARPRVERGQRWLRLEEGGLWFVVPGTGEDLAAWVKHALASGDEGALPAWIEAVTTDAREGTLRARIGGPDPDAPELWRIDMARGAAPYDDRLLELLRADASVEIRPAVERAELRALLTD